jgi:hypothetical protein
VPARSCGRSRPREGEVQESYGPDVGSAVRCPAGRQCARRKARAAAEEVANYDGELTKLRVGMSGLRLEISERLNRVESELRLHRWMIGFLIAIVLGVFALQWQILLRLPS